MSQKIIIIGIIFFSLISGGIGAFGMHYFLGNSHSSLSPEEEDGGGDNVGENIEIKDIENSITQTVENISQSIVSIIIKKDLVIYRSDPWGFFQRPAGSINRKVGGGSGFFIHSDGTILTNKHVVSDNTAEYTVILQDGSEYDATVVALDPVNDLAVIKITDNIKDFTPLVIAKGNDIHIGQFAIAVGNALSEFQNSVSLGIISGKNRVIEAGSEVLSGLIQTDAAINPGNSGGPLLNLSGEVVGINTAIASNSDGIGFAIGLTEGKINYILQSIADSGRIKRPFIGVNYILNSPGVAEELELPVDYGIYIINDPESVIAGSSADKAGLKPGDIILEINGAKVNNQLTLANIIQNYIPGDIIELKVLSESEKEKTILLELGEY